MTTIAIADPDIAPGLAVPRFLYRDINEGIEKAKAKDPKYKAFMEHDIFGLEYNEHRRRAAAGRKRWRKK